MALVKIDLLSQLAQNLIIVFLYLCESKCTLFFSEQMILNEAFSEYEYAYFKEKNIKKINHSNI